jgi:hypothetical protein
MAKRKVKIWFDREADYLEVLMKVSSLTKAPLEVML